MRFIGRRRAAAVAVATALSVALSAPSHAASDEEQVRSILNGMNASYNRSDFEAFASYLCADMLRAEGFKTNWFTSRKNDGPTRITVNSVALTGGIAVANVRFEAANQKTSKTLDVDFVREKAGWKACHYDAGTAV